MWRAMIHIKQHSKLTSPLLFPNLSLSTRPLKIQVLWNVTPCGLVNSYVSQHGVISQNTRHFINAINRN
jgi:hypothetical protein